MTLAVIVLAVLVTLAACSSWSSRCAQPPAARRSCPRATEQPRARIGLRERRDAAYAALRELELDHRTGKLDGRGLRRSRDGLRAEAMEALRELERLDGEG